MILSLSRVDTIRVEDMLKRSYAEVDSVRQIPQRKVELTEMTRQLNELTKNTNYPAYIDEHYSSLSRLFEMTLELQVSMQWPLPMYVLLTYVLVCSGHFLYTCYLPTYLCTSVTSFVHLSKGNTSPGRCGNTWTYLFFFL